MTKLLFNNKEDTFDLQTYLNFSYSFVVCRPGFFNDTDGTCAECEMGFYQSQFIDVDMCTTCGDNRTTLDAASDGEDKCGKQQSIDQVMTETDVMTYSYSYLSRNDVPYLKRVL